MMSIRSALLQEKNLQCTRFCWVFVVTELDVSSNHYMRTIALKGKYTYWRFAESRRELLVEGRNLEEVRVRLARDERHLVVRHRVDGRPVAVPDHNLHQLQLVQVPVRRP